MTANTFYFIMVVLLYAVSVAVSYRLGVCRQDKWWEAKMRHWAAQQGVFRDVPQRDYDAVATMGAADGKE